MAVRQELGDFIRGITTIPLPPQTNVSILDYEVAISGEWNPWAQRVPQIEVETHKVAAPDVVVPTLDTVRHESLLYTWLAEHKPLVLCGPPGSGKTMTLFSGGFGFICFSLPLFWLIWIRLFEVLILCSFPLLFFILLLFL